MDLTDVWLNADEIDFAWLHYGEAALADQYRDGKNQARADVAQRILIADLYRDLADGEVIAIGFQTAPIISGMPVVVPRHMFGDGPPPDWDSGQISASGLAFDRVKVLPAPEFQRLISHLHATPSRAPLPEPAVHLPEKQDIPRSRKAGRKDTYALCASVFDFWAKTEPGLLKLSAEQLAERFTRDYDTIHGEVAKFTPAPKVGTLRKKLGEYRSAKIDRNQQE